MPDIKKISPQDTGYPSLLKEIEKAPNPLFYLGELPKNEKIIAIVGTRKATSEGKLIAKQIAKELTDFGIIIASGLALGIDTAAHEGVVATNGKTIAVLANGLDSIYPKTNEMLAKKIIGGGGAILSEYAPNEPPYPNQFLERNRIISGISMATIIIEAPIRSGALVTAKHALDQGKEVFVIPGPCRSQNYKGSHFLIRSGARLVTSTNDILEDLNLLDLKKDFLEETCDATEELIIQTLKSSNSPVSIDKIIEITKLQPQIINQKITTLMFKNIIEENNQKFKIK